MEDKDQNEYNSIGAPSEEVKRKLLYLAEIGSESVTSAFRISASYGASIRQEKQDAADAQFHALAEMAIASQERIAQFRSELTVLDEASMAALLENEEKRRMAQEKLDDLRERAFVAKQPDGSTIRVYRDGAYASDENGNRVDSVIAADLPSETPDYPEFENAKRAMDNVLIERKAIIEYREQIGQAQERLDQGSVKQGELRDLKAGLDDMPVVVAEHRNRILAERSVSPQASVETKAVTERTLNTPIQPTQDFAAAAPAVSADDFAAMPSAEPLDPQRPVNPGSSTPAPM